MLSAGSSARVGGATASDAAAARVSDGSRRSRSSACGSVARSESSRASPAYTPPSRGSTSRSSTSRPSRCSMSHPTLTSSSGSAVAGRSRSRAARARPSALSTADSARPSRSAGIPITDRGSGTERPAGPDPGGRGLGVHHRVAQAGSAGQSDTLGSSVEDRLRPQVDRDAGDLAAPQLAAQPVRPLQQEHLDRRVRLEQGAGRREAGDAAPDHDHASRQRSRGRPVSSHGPSLANAPASPGNRSGVGCVPGMSAGAARRRAHRRNNGGGS